MFYSDIRTSLSFVLLCTTSAIALSSAAQAQSTTSETIVVTGSRVIADAANSPTPLTIVTAAQLQATTPTGDITDGLNKLPAFIGSNNARTAVNSGTNAEADALNLRNLGANRTLVLFDGKRAVSSSQDNTVDVAALPQMLVQRVDVVTGGASAVYGSDAVTGVVNFVLDKHFTGWKVDASGGISTYSDGPSYKLGVAAGSDIFGGRGHVEGDFRIYHQDSIYNLNRPNSNVLLTGAGTQANPYAYSVNSRDTVLSRGGKVTCTCAANNMQFIDNGILGPFFPGTPTGTSGVGIGGDGTTHGYTSLSPLQAAEESFGRFSYNINDNTTFYIQGSINQSFTKARLTSNYVINGATPSGFFVNNPYLPAAAQALLASGNTTGKFTNNIIFQNFGPWNGQPNAGLVDTQSVTAGFDGAIGDYDWSVYYTHGNSRTKEDNSQNQNQQKEWAANDAVVGAGGTVQCYVNTPAAGAALNAAYPNCVPTNVFGPTAITPAAFNYFIQDTYFIEQDIIDDLGGSISGNLMNNWAGPIKGALSFESTWRSFASLSNVNPGFVDCTGLRLCNTLTPLFLGTATATVPTANENVWEVAGEVNVPLLKNVPLVQDLSVDFAGRYTDYSITGSVETWKIGLDYHVNDEVRFRATNSFDIRAPNLFELYKPPTIAHTTYNDTHTQSSVSTTQSQQGNPNLTPELSRTYSAGVVFTPDFIPGLTASIDYYRIRMTDVISAVGGSSPGVQQVCQASGGTSPLCALAIRPLPFSNTTTVNFPTLILIQNLNAAFQRTEGWDLELDYGFQMSDVWADAPGSVSLRMLANIQPVLESVPFQGAPLTFTGTPEASSQSAANYAMSKGHVTSFLDYTLGSWTFNLADRWIGGFASQTTYGVYYTNPRVNSVNYQDITIDKKFNIDGQSLDGYLSIQNVGNITPPLTLATNSSKPGNLAYGITGGNQGAYDLVGRYFTLGIRARF